jgi:hypothetical protein
MEHQMKFIILLSGLLGLGNAHASVITYQSRTINSGVNNLDYKASWASQTSAITTQTLSSFNQTMGGNNTFSYLKVDFSSNAGSMSFQLAVDATYGGALYLDNQRVDYKPSDLWWGSNNNWANTAELLTYTGPVNSGNHILEVFWAENCCNGANSGRFSLNGGTTWQSFSNVSFAAIAPVPVPASVWLFGTGIVGLLGTIRRKKVVVA